jgi:hypothetical protein
MTSFEGIVQLERCPVCGEMKVLCTVGIYAKIPICEVCRADEELCDFLGILPGGVVSG